MTIQNIFTKIPDSGFSQLFLYLERNDAQNLASVDKELSQYFSKHLSQRVRDVFDTLYVLRTPSRDVRHQICAGDTLRLEDCYRTLQQYRLHHLVMILSSHPEDNLPSIESCPEGMPSLSVLSLKISFTFRHSHTIRSFMQAMELSNFSFEQVTFTPTMNEGDFQENLQTVRSSYFIYKKCFGDFPKVADKVTYDFPGYRIASDSTMPLVIDGQDFTGEGPFSLTVDFTNDIPNLALLLDKPTDVSILQNVIPNNTSVQNLQIGLPNEAENYVDENIEKQYQDLFRLIQTKFTNITELVINSSCPSIELLFALYGNTIHPILDSFPNTKVFFVFDKLDVDPGIDHINFQSISRNQIAHIEDYNGEAAIQADLLENEGYLTGPDSQWVSPTMDQNKGLLKMVISNDGRIKYFPDSPSIRERRLLEALSIKFPEKNAVNTNIVTDKMYSGLVEIMRSFSSLKTIFIKPRVFNSLSPLSIQTEFNSLSFFIQETVLYILFGRREGGVVLDSNKLYLDAPNDAQLVKEELDRLQTTHTTSLEIRNPTFIRIDAAKMNDDLFCLDLMTSTLNKLVFDVSTMEDLELFNMQFATLFAGSVPSVQTVHFNLSENINELDENGVMMYGSNAVQLLNQFPDLKKVHFRSPHLGVVSNQHYSSLLEVMERILEEKPQIGFILHSNKVKIHLTKEVLNKLKIAHTISLEVEEDPTFVIDSAKMRDDDFCKALMTNIVIDNLTFEISAMEDTDLFNTQFTTVFKNSPIHASVKAVHINFVENMGESEDDITMCYSGLPRLIQQFRNVKEVHVKPAHLGSDLDGNYILLLRVIEMILEQSRATLVFHQNKVKDNMDFTHIEHKNFILKG